MAPICSTLHANFGGSTYGGGSVYETLSACSHAAAGWFLLEYIRTDDKRNPGWNSFGRVARVDSGGDGNGNKHANGNRFDDNYERNRSVQLPFSSDGNIQSIGRASRISGPTL